MNEEEDKKDSAPVNTGGGAYFGGNVSTGGGKIVGRDQHVHGDVVQGDKVEGDKVGGDIVKGDKISIGGNVEGTGIAIGRGATAQVTQGVSGAELAKLFAPLMETVKEAPEENREMATQKAEQLRKEVAKDKKADDSKVAGLIEDLVDLVPAAAGTITGIFASPAIGAVVGKVTEFVLKRLKRKPAGG